MLNLMSFAKNSQARSEPPLAGKVERPPCGFEGPRISTSQNIFIGTFTQILDNLKQATLASFKYFPINHFNNLNISHPSQLFFAIPTTHPLQISQYPQVPTLPQKSFFSVQRIFIQQPLKMVKLSL